MLGFGAFVMMQRQMIGIRSRAERIAIEEALPPLARTPNSRPPNASRAGW